MDVKKEKDIKKLIELIDPAKQQVEFLRGLFVNVTKVDKSKWNDLIEEMNSDLIASLYCPSYDKYFTQEEIRELIDFYLTEPGKKLALSKSDAFGSQNISLEELDEIESFKKTEVGKKYNKLLKKINQEHIKLIKSYINRLE